MFRDFEFYFQVLSLVLLLGGRDTLQDDQLQCGVPKASKTELIVRGSDTVRGAWPWQAAIYHKSGRSETFQCGGTLISGPYVLTAAHCTINTENRHQLVNSRIFVRLGVHNLDNQHDFVQRHQLNQIHTPGNFTGHGFRNDIAILELGTVPRLNDYVQPACLSLSKDLTGLYGTVIGWGVTENDEVSPTLNGARLPVVDVITCLQSNRDVFGQTLDDGIFCAGYTNGTSACNGDSGGGIFFKEGNAWHLGGIVSYTVPRENSYLCDPNNYGAFTKVSKYLPWISSVTGLKFSKSTEVPAARNLPKTPINTPKPFKNTPQPFNHPTASPTPPVRNGNVTPHVRSGNVTKSPPLLVTNHDHVVVCYLLSGALYRTGSGAYSLNQFDPKLCTHAIYAFAGLDMMKNVIKSLDPWQDLKEHYGKGGYEKLIAMRNSNPNLKVLLAIGGWSEDSKKYSDMAANPESRQTFVKSALKFVKRFGFDGLDLVWQFPTQRGGKPFDRKNFVSLVKELSEQFKTNNLLLTSAIGAKKDTIDAAYDIENLSKYLDFLHILCYNYNERNTKIGFNAPLQSHNTWNVESTIEHLLAMGAPSNKIVLGLPFYGRTFVTRSKHAQVGDDSDAYGFSGPSQENGFIGYNEICAALKESPDGWTVSWDAEASEAIATMPDGDRTKVIIYDNTRSMANKVRYAIRHNLRGLMVWSVDTDDFNGLCDSEEETFADFGGQNNIQLNITPPVQPKYKLLKTVNDAIKVALDELNQEKQISR